MQNNINKAVISEYKHCKSIHLENGQQLNFIFTFYADSSTIQDNLFKALKEYGFNNAIWNSKLHTKSDAFVAYAATGCNLNLKAFIKLATDVFQLANDVGADYLYFEIGEVQEYYSNGQYEADMELQEAFADLLADGGEPF